MKSESPARKLEQGLHLDLKMGLESFVLQVAADLGPTAAILGPSGAGKTSLLEAIAGLRRARGSITFAGETLLDSNRGVDVPPEARRIGYVPQELALFPHLTVEQNLLFGRPRRERRALGEDGRKLVSALELGGLLHRSPRRLSGGEQRRVALARALLARPRLLLLDEPTAGLDPRRARRALAEVLAVRRQWSVPTLVVTHRPQEALALAEEVLVLEGGRPTAQGPARQVLYRPELLRDTDGGENLVAAVIAGHDAQGGVTRARQEDGSMLTLPLEEGLQPGSQVLLAVGADEVLVATQEPRGLSARNLWQARIDEIFPAGRALYVRAGPWLARLTPSAVEELGLAPGSTIWLVVKSHSWRVVAG